MARISAIPKSGQPRCSRASTPTPRSGSASRPNLFRTLAHRPELLITFANFYRELWTGGVLDTRTKELVALRVAVLNGCHY